MVKTETEHDFWDFLDRLVTASAITIDRPAGSCHPRYPDMVYPVSYGYLEQTTANDGGGIDVWLGDPSQKQVNGIICTVDLQKRDAEIKVVLGCSDQEVEMILAFLNQSGMRAFYIERPPKRG